MNISTDKERLRREKISKRMKVVRQEIPNPMESEETRAKLSATMKARGVTFTMRGGNGTIAPTQMLLYRELVRLRPTWLWNLEFAESNGPRSVSQAAGLPTNYKIDIASVTKKIAVEVDGGTHSTKSARVTDAKKDDVLRSRGWFVLRFKNETVQENAARVARTVVDTFIRSQPRPGAI